MFAPPWWASLTTVVLGAMFLSLGRWQLHRAAEKRAEWTAFSAPGLAVESVSSASPPLARYRFVRARGHYDSAHQILIDNMPSASGRAGYYVITPFELEGGGTVLVNRGWVPLGPSRQQPPGVRVGEQMRKIQGRTEHLPAAGIKMGTPAPLAPPFPIVATYPSAAAIGAVIGKAELVRATPVIILDSKEPDGYERHWQPPGFAPQRHIAYAVQWFALAATLLVIYLRLNTRRIESR
jgi:cytochrome oxidase assembly protein ShyY1